MGREGKGGEECGEERQHGRLQKGNESGETEE